MSDKNTKSHKRKIIHIKENFRFAVIQKYKLAFKNRQVGKPLLMNTHMPYPEIVNPAAKAIILGLFVLLFIFNAFRSIPKIIFQ